jgi:probable rRNA maturation factor
MKNPTLYINFAATKEMPAADYELKKTLRAAILKTLAYEKFSKPAQISVTVCDNAYIQKINKKFRDIDRATDVLSFPMYEAGEWENEGDFGPIPLGDIVISLERTEEQAKELSHSFLREAAFLAIHSTLHLLGYDHERSKEDEEEQCRRQRDIIESMNFNRKEDEK